MPHSQYLNTMVLITQDELREAVQAIDKLRVLREKMVKHLTPIQTQADEHQDVLRLIDVYLMNTQQVT